MNNDDNIDNDDGAVGDPIQVEQLLQQQAAAAAAVRAARRRRKLKLTTILDCQEDFPLRQRNRMDELVEEYVEKLENDIHSMLCARYDDEDYQGLDSDRDTDAEVETALRHFPGSCITKRGSVR